GTPPPLPPAPSAAAGEEDTYLHSEPDQPLPSRSSTDDAPAERRSWTELYPRILRWTGALLLAIAALSFLVSGWVNGSPLLRTGSFLGFTALLSGAGIFCTYRWREDKGARTFLALATAFLPANFAQLGALIYAQMHGSMAYSVGLKKVFTFEPVGLTPLLATIGISLIVLIPLAYTGFSALARNGAKKMTGLFLVSNALLLLPWRDGDLVAGLAVLLVTGLVVADRVWFSRETSLKTWDGVAMRSLLFAPVGLLVIRNLCMHPMSDGLMCFILTAGALLLFSGLPRCLPLSGLRIASQSFSYPLMLGAWIVAVDACLPLHHLSDTIILPVLLLPWCLGLFGLSFKSEGKGIALRGIASVLMLMTCLLNISIFGEDGYLPSIIGLLTALALLLVAFVLEERTVLLAGAATLIFTVGYHLHLAFSFVQQNLWISLAVAGTSIILASSYLERNGGGLRQRAQRVRHRLKSWH
ncbi:MAG: hypothetical protein ACQKBW_10540, partial [Puniceicoccales bacterium]